MKPFGAIIPDSKKFHPSGSIMVNIPNEGKFKLKTNQTSYVTRNLFWNGALNYEYTKIFIKLIKKNNSFFDIGASIGYFSVLGGLVNKELSIYSFEPTEGPMVYLCENLKINGLTNRSIVEPKALSNKIGTAKFNIIRNKKYPTIYNLSGEHNLLTKSNLDSKTISVETSTLDHFIKENKIKSVDVLKIDTEATEDLILEGALTTIKEFRPIIICELLFNRIEDKIEKIVSPLNYVFYGHQNNSLIKLPTLKRDNDNGIRDVFMVPKEKIDAIQEFIIV